METKQVALDAVPFNRYHFKLVAYVSGCTLVTGYVIGSVSIALAVMQKQMDMSAVMSGLIGMGALLGMIFGSLVGGRLTDILGRKRMYVLDFILLTVLSLLQLFVTSPLQICILRILLGIGIGPAFSIAGPYLAELSPQKNRGTMVSILNAMWFIGYALSNVICYLLLPLGASSWRWMLASSAVPTIIWLIGIRKMPESPRWLMSHGRGAEVPAILKRIGPNVVLPEEPEKKNDAPKASFRDIFKGGYAKWVFFVAAFWTLQIIPTFGIGTYLPTIMMKMGFSGGNLQYLGAAIINCLYLLGLIPIFLYMDKAGRRPTMILTFLICGIALLILAVTTNMKLPFWLVLLLFVIFGASNTASGSHQFVYPNELFPTEVRATAVGFVTSVTRVLSALFTFVTPTLLSKFGLQTMLYICAGTAILGVILAVVMAPETKGMNLNDTANLTHKSKVTPTPQQVQQHI